MTKHVSTKRALILSLLSMLLCVSMLVGSTYAWFTDTATTAVNKIQVGTLDVALEMKDNDGNWVSAEGKTLQFLVDGKIPAEGTKILWEPGCTYSLPELRVVNNSNLALKYKVVITGINGDAELNKVIDWTIKLGGENYAADATHSLAVGGYHTLTVEGHMQETAGNQYQGKTISGIGVTVYATQDTVEKDSNDEKYDDDAAKDEFRQAVTVSGIAGAAESYDSIQAAYEDVKAMLVANSGLVEQPLSEETFNNFFTDGGRITWTIYGNQTVTDTRMFSFGRAANRFGEGRHITEINIVGGNVTAALDLSEVNGTFALPYNWWNVEDSANTALKCKNITFNGINSMPSTTYQCVLYPTIYEFDGCTFNGNLFSYQNFDVDMTIKNCVFNAPENTQYAFMSQGAGGKITLDNNVFNGYTRGINLQRPTVDFVVTNNTIKSTCAEADRGAIQLTDGKSFVVTGNKVDVNAGNAFWFHNAATNADVTYVINDNDINAPYLGYSGVTAFDVNTKITSSGNKFNGTDTTNCMKKGATNAEATNLTAIK